MRVKKKNVSSVSFVNADDRVSNSTDSSYSEAIEYIQSAISCLSVVAKQDQLAKESIANLSVVLLDLKG